MTIEAEFPLYVLVGEETREMLAAGDDVSGFFIDRKDVLPEVIFSGVREAVGRKSRADDAILEVVNRRQEKIGEYFIGRAIRGRIETKSESDKGIDTACIAFRSFGNRCEFTGAGEIWRYWASNVEPELGEWLRWPAERHEDWLHVVQNSWFARGRRAGRYGADRVILLDGAGIRTKAGFYCALGEAVNGPRGYFGSNLDALADCLSSNYGEGNLALVEWRSIADFRKLVGESFPESIVRVMREFNVEVRV